MEGFREAVHTCGFSDLGFIGLPYTWDNRQQSNDNVKVKLDRGLANSTFLNLFRDVRVWHVQTTESDHCCLVVDCSKGSHSRHRGRRRFRYENMWRRHSSYSHAVEAAWRCPEGSVALENLAQHLGTLGRSLGDWDHVFGSVHKKLAQLHRELERVRGQSIGSEPSGEERRLMKEISELLSREEMMKKQRSRIDWLKEGDHNTSFFSKPNQKRERRATVLLPWYVAMEPQLQSKKTSRK